MDAPKVLIVDDDEIIRILLRHTLGNEAYLVLEAADGQQALDMVDQEMPDLILLDVMMPVMDGIEVLRRLKSQDRTRSIPVIIITALTAESDVATSLEEGAVDHISKPFSELIVRTRVRAALRNRPAVRAQPPAVKRGRRIGFLGVKGGVGVTTSAVNTALAMASPQRTVALVELHASPGTMALHLGVAAERDLQPLLNTAENLHPAALDSCMMRHRSGVKVLLTPPTIDHRREIAPRHAEDLLNALGELFDYVLVDLPCQPSATQSAALRACDFVVLTIELEATCLALSRTMLEYIAASQVRAESVGAVLVLHEPAAGTLIGVSSARTQVPCPMVGVIPPCPHQNLQALKTGVPVVYSAPDCAAAIAYTELGARLMADRILALTF
jgi:DNA-binding response OmpR family regulator